MPGTPQWAGSYATCMRQLAIWAQQRGEPLGPKLVSELRRLGLLGEFYRETPHTFVTVVLPKDMEIQTACDMTSSMSHKWLDQAQAVLEGWPAGNPHMHLITRGRPKKQNIIRCFTKRYGVRPEKVDIQQSNCPELYHRRRAEYVQGVKCKEKLDAVAADRQYRDERDIPHVLSFFS